MMAGAPVTTAGGVPMGAGTIRPRAEPGGGGTNTPWGPRAKVPTTPGRATDSDRRSVGGGGTKARPGAHQKPLTNTTALPRCS